MMEEGVYFLQDDYIKKANNVLMLQPDLLETFLKSLAIIRESEDLCMLALHCHNILYHTAGNICEYSEWRPLLDACMGEYAEMFPAIVCISGLPEITGFYETGGIPIEILIDTLSDVRVTMEEFRNKHGKWGLELQDWLMGHFTGKLFKLGRFQFVHNTFNRDFCVYRNKKTKELLTFALSGVKFRADGLIEGTGGVFSGDKAFTSSLTIDGNYLSGNPVTPEGICENRQTYILLDEWEQVLAKGQGILEVHIQKGEPLSQDVCLSSYLKAIDFYSAYFSEKTFVAYTCESWLLDTQFRQILQPTSNILEFQKNYYLYPILNDGNDVFNYVFHKKPSDFTKAPKDTSLKRAIIDYVLAGNQMNSSGGFILKDRYLSGLEVAVSSLDFK